MAPRGKKEGAPPPVTELDSVLASVGLKKVNIDNDGNCLFSSLSDQHFGTPTRHFEIRTTLVTYIRDHKDEFITFIRPGENTKDRSHMTRGARASQNSSSGSDKSLEQTLEEHMAKMAQPGEWGTEREIAAFARAYSKSVIMFVPAQPTKLYRRPGYVDGEAGPYIHIAYGGADILEHYTSVRKIGGELPGANPDIISSFEIDNQPIATPKQIATIKEALEVNGLKYDTEMIKNVLEKCRGDLNNAFSHLIDQDRPSSSRSSSQHSSGSKRSAAESDTDEQRRVKRRDTRLSLKRRARVTGVVHGEADSVEVAFHVRVDSPTEEEINGNEEEDRTPKKGKEVATEKDDNPGSAIKKEKAKESVGSAVGEAE